MTEQELLDILNAKSETSEVEPNYDQMKYGTLDQLASEADKALFQQYLKGETIEDFDGGAGGIAQAPLKQYRPPGAK